MGKNISCLSEAMKDLASNISSSTVSGAKGVQPKFTQFMSGAGTSTTLLSHVQTHGIAGSIETSVLDVQNMIGIDTVIPPGCYMAVRSPLDSGSEMMFTQSGSFRVNEKGNMMTLGGHALLGWKIRTDSSQGAIPRDAQGLPINKASPASLEQVNIKDLAKTPPTPSTTVQVSANLSTTQPVLQGPGVRYTFTGSNRAMRNTDIIIPENAGLNGHMVPGTVFTFCSPPKGPESFEYGGITMTNKIDTSPMYQVS